MIKFYSSHCAKCKVLENLLKEKGVEFEVIDDDKVYMPIARQNRILSMPFAEVEGKILNSNELRDYINEI